MRVGFVVNRVQFQLPKYSTTLLALECQRRGHETFLIDASELEASLLCRATPAGKRTESSTVFLKDTQNQSPTPIDTRKLDWVLNRYNPYGTYFDADANTLLDRLSELAEAKVGLLNRPHGLRKAADKSYLLDFPVGSTPRTLFSPGLEQNPAALTRFLESSPGPWVIKPSQGYGGENVRKVDSPAEARANLESLPDSLIQEFVASHPQSDVRVLLFHGRVLHAQAQPCVFARVAPKHDFRSNLRQGGQRQAATLSSAQLDLIAQIGPQLRDDGLNYVGLDLIGNKMIELNVFCPGGILPIDELYGVNTSAALFSELEWANESKRRY